ncbi:protein FAR1-RELATED SEQUENCE 5-like [Olea europaea var. sylvestris]|uniref:protein FAR1-RELATED SEQUENCE 5-like n=1 Tax=Olea europaea var. sylvestris TaxID=158386 RepID=UPI000C1D49B6|nr:protein FAR1-RELATED SEQUENCE 5-like [Olea europaea var. sylvestris]
MESIVGGVILVGFFLSVRRDQLRASSGVSCGEMGLVKGGVKWGNSYCPGLSDSWSFFRKMLGVDDFPPPVTVQRPVPQAFSLEKWASFRLNCGLQYAVITFVLYVRLILDWKHAIVPAFGKIMEDVNDELEESSNDNGADNMNKVEDERLGENGQIVPEVGMMFNNETEMFEMYKRYAYDIGFPVRRRNSKKGNDGILRYVTFTCSREGKRSSNANCCGRWRINTVHLDHNHETSPSKSRLYRCNRELSANVKRKLEVNDVAGIPLHKSYNSAVAEVGGYENMTCIEKNCKNYIEQVRCLRLGEGDAAAIQSYFSKMQAKCSEFYFSIDLDDECRLKNVFWADDRCRQAYKEFGDVVTFDTTYLTNKYDMPFAPFVGVNHHGQSILFACGLLANEDTDTFVWLFRTWLECMHGQAPNAIITDQDRAMQNAIGIVFPCTRHRWCLWHILKKLLEKFGYHVDKCGIFSTLHNLVYDSQTAEEFEEGWEQMIDAYDLHENEWLSGLYDNRGRWVPCFLRTTFWAGMSTTQRSGSMNAFFDGYVHSKTSLNNL